MPYEPYPRSMYRLAEIGFPYEGKCYAMLTVHSAEEEAAAQADGWLEHPHANPIVSAVADMAASIAKFDHDGDGRPGGSKRRKVTRRDNR